MKDLERHSIHNTIDKLLDAKDSEIDSLNREISELKSGDAYTMKDLERHSIHNTIDRLLDSKDSEIDRLNREISELKSGEAMKSYIEQLQNVYTFLGIDADGVKKAIDAINENHLSMGDVTISFSNVPGLGYVTVLKDQNGKEIYSGYEYL